MNFDNAPVATVAKTILGDILGVGYVIDPRAQGTITLSSGRPIAKKNMLFVLESALRANNLVLVRDGQGYKIGPAGDMTAGGVDRETTGGTTEPGFGISVIPVHYISGAALAKILEGFALKPGAIRTDPAGTTLVILGNGEERQTALDAVRSFDVDWMRGQSVGIYPVHNSTPEPVIAELEKIMDAGDSGLSHNLVKFQSIDRQNAVMVVANRPVLLKTAAQWISRLDSSVTASTGIKVYHVKYGDAVQIARLLNSMLGGGGSSATESSPSNQLAPASGAATLSAVDRLTGGAKLDASSSLAARPAGTAQTDSLAPAGNTNTLSANGAGDAANSALPGVRITPDAVNNAILIYADQQNYRIIQNALNQIDRPKLQVAIDVTIAEVDLNNDLSYGVQFFLHNRFGSLINSAGGSPISETLPGANLLIGNQVTPNPIINALDKYTKVKVLSNPSLVVVDNQPATLEVGDQVPVSTGTATVLSASNTVVSTIDYRNTGIILHVLPRVNSDGNVLLDIDQEISSARPGSNLTPTISQRKVQSSLSVANGQTVLLAGLVSETATDTRTGIPVLDRLPVLGPAFSSTDKPLQRTELIMFIRPQIIRDGADASVVAEELRAKMSRGQFAPVAAPYPGAPSPKGIR
ncbi:MAG TPA: type II secretion system secretin GspD [Beijerinckiaceae bacterium]|nr:type II secretion system secretin GspD [Beijerinckiaceae bacterium]